MSSSRRICCWTYKERYRQRKEEDEQEVYLPSLKDATRSGEETLIVKAPFSFDLRLLHRVHSAHPLCRCRRLLTLDIAATLLQHLHKLSIFLNKRLYQNKKLLLPIRFQDKKPMIVNDRIA